MFRAVGQLLTHRQRMDVVCALVTQIDRCLADARTANSISEADGWLAEARQYRDTYVAIFGQAPVGWPAWAD